MADVDFSSFMVGTAFDDVLPEDVTVSLIEYIEEDHKLSDGNTIKRRRPRKRTATISCYVPMKIFHRMMASQERIKKFQVVRAGGEVDPANQQMMLEWMTEQVAAVWQLSEPDMTAEKLADGLSFQKVMGLFGLFFGDQLKSLSEQVK